MSQEVRIARVVEVNVTCACGSQGSERGITRKACFDTLKERVWNIKLRRKGDPTVVCPACVNVAIVVKLERKAAAAAIRSKRDAAIDESRAEMKKLKEKNEGEVQDA